MEKFLLNGIIIVLPILLIRFLLLSLISKEKGIIDILIQEAKQYAKSNSAGIVEAYPVQHDSPNYRFMGFVRTFEKADFEFEKKACLRRHVMIYKL